jgi:prepilin-type N-terminal cleavage/methylation domain-containing protein/prepilin-type processing-associated H-X9-DG protein
MESRGLTLVELLVVMSVVAVLFAFLFPALHSSREQAKATRCAANLRQLLLELHAYEAENESLPYGFDGTRTTPPPGGYLGNTMIDIPGWWWLNYMGAVRHKSLSDLGAVRCPSKRLGDPRLTLDVLCGNYGVNLSLCKSASYVYDDEMLVGTPVATGNIHNPGSTLLIVDSGYSTICWWHAAQEPPVEFGSAIQDAAYIPGLEINKDKTLWAGQAHDAVGGRHPGKTVNVGFADGHISRVKASELLVERTGENEWSHRPLWSPK